MDHPLRLEPVDLAVRPWRLAALAIGAVAAVELLLLVVAGGALLARDDATSASSAKRDAVGRSAAPTAKRAGNAGARLKPRPNPPAKARPKPHAAVAADLPRRRVTVVVLNGNGRSGAAAATASRVSRRGYRIGLVGNAGSHTYPRSIVMYRRGFAAEGKRLAHDLGVPIVSPLDGMRSGQLHGAHAVLILGA